MISTKLLHLKPGLCLSPILRQMSAHAPTLSSLGDTSKIVTKLSLPSVGTMVMTGQPTRPFPASYNVDVEEFMLVAKGTVSVVTRAMANQGLLSILMSLILATMTLNLSG